MVLVAFMRVVFLAKPIIIYRLPRSSLSWIKMMNTVPGVVKLRLWFIKLESANTNSVCWYS